MAVDVVEAGEDEALVGLGLGGEAALVKPGGGPGEGVKEEAAVAGEALRRGVLVEACADLREQGLGELLVRGGLHVRSLP